MTENIRLPSICLSITSNVVTAVGLPIAAGMLNGISTRGVVRRGRWYKNLHFPPGRPPPRAFPIVWATLYACMGYTSYLATKAFQTGDVSVRQQAYRGLVIYWGQLAVNLVWPTLFFNLQRTGLALVDIALLATLVGSMTAVLHEPTNGVSTWLLAPYCAWLGLASYLNAGIVYLNWNRDFSGLED